MTDRIGELLVSDGIVTQEQVDEALAVQHSKGGKTFELLIELGYLDKDQLHAFLSKQQGVAGIDLANYELDEKYKELVPKDVATESLVLPIDKMGRLLTVAMACPLDTATIEKIEQASGLRVKAMLARLDDVKAAVERYYAEREDTADAEHFRGIIGGGAGGEGRPAPGKRLLVPALEKLDQIPGGEDIVSRVAETAGDPQSSIRDVVELITTEPPLAAWILNVANSAAYGLAQQVSSVALAGVLMGKDGAGQVVGMLPTRNGDAGKSDGLDYEAMRARAVCCGTLAQIIATVTERAPSGAAFTAGLLHEIGRLALATVKADRYMKVDHSLSGKALAEAELRAVGLAHPEAGFIVTNAWGFPKPITLGIKHYLDPGEAESEGKDAALVVAAAAALTPACLPENPLPEKEVMGEGFDILQQAGISTDAASKIIAKATVTVNARF